MYFSLIFIIEVEPAVLTVSVERPDTTRSAVVRMSCSRSEAAAGVLTLLLEKLKYNKHLAATNVSFRGKHGLKLHQFYLNPF